MREERDEMTEIEREKGTEREKEREKERERDGGEWIGNGRTEYV